MRESGGKGTTRDGAVVSVSECYYPTTFFVVVPSCDGAVRWSGVVCGMAKMTLPLRLRVRAGRPFRFECVARRR